MKLPSLSPKYAKHLKEMDVEAIYLFGSRALGVEHPLADYDYAVLTGKSGYQKGDPLYYRLYDILSEISPRTVHNDVIDIVFLRDAGLELRFHVIRYGVVLYDESPILRLQFEVQTELLYCDFRPMLDQFDQALLEAI